MNIPELTEEQQNIIISKWNETPAAPPTLKDLTNLIFPGKLGRDPEGMAVKKFLSTRNLKAISRGAEPTKSSLVEFTEEQKLFIINRLKQRSHLPLTIQPPCHSEHSEESSEISPQTLIPSNWILRCVQNENWV